MRPEGQGIGEGKLKIACPEETGRINLQKIKFLLDKRKRM